MIYHFLQIETFEIFYRYLDLLTFNYMINLSLSLVSLIKRVFMIWSKNFEKSKFKIKSEIIQNFKLSKNHLNMLKICKILFVFGKDCTNLFNLEKCSKLAWFRSLIYLQRILSISWNQWIKFITFKLNFFS